MKDFVDGTAFKSEQGNRARKLFAAVVLASVALSREESERRNAAAQAEAA